MNPGKLFTYASIMLTFRNGYSIVQNLRKGGLRNDGPILNHATLWNGKTISHPNARGFVGMLLEHWVQNVYRLGEFYEPQDDDVVLDIGAHIGLFSLSVHSRNPATQVVAVEPCEQNFNFLCGNLEVFGASNVLPLNIAIGAEPGRAELNVPGSGRTHDVRTKVISPHISVDESVRMQTLAGIMKEVNSSKIALLKMDCEGAEYDVFENIELTTLTRLDKIAMEYHENWRTGVLDLLISRLNDSHSVEVIRENGGHGTIFATLK